MNFETRQRCAYGTCPPSKQKKTRLTCQLPTMGRTWLHWSLSSFLQRLLITHTPGILTPGDFQPDRSGDHVVPRWKSPDVMVDCEFGWKSHDIMVSVSSRWKSPHVLVSESSGWKSLDVMVRVSFLFPSWCLDIVKIDKTPLIYSFNISICGGLEHCMGELSPPNPLCDDGTGHMWDMKVNSSAAINLIVQQLSWSIYPFWASLPYAPDFRKNLPILGKVD